MYVWSKRLVSGLLIGFLVLFTVFVFEPPMTALSTLKGHTTRWILLNYIGLMIWIGVWMFDQARVRGKNLALWVIPFLFAPLPTLMLFVLAMQKRMKG